MIAINRLLPLNNIHNSRNDIKAISIYKNFNIDANICKRRRIKNSLSSVISFDIAQKHQRVYFFYIECILISKYVITKDIQ